MNQAMPAAVNLPLWITAVEWVSRSILILLALLSVWSVALMVEKRRAFKDYLGRELEDAKELLHANKISELKTFLDERLKNPALSVSASVPLRTLATALQTPAHSSEAVDRAVRSFLATERSQLEKGLTPLATLGSNAPFIGLFGTVLGIIQAFGALAAQSSNAQSVMTGISEALVATAVGLFVAIPAVIAYNVFSRKLKLILVESEALRDLYLSKILSAGENPHGR